MTTKTTEARREAFESWAEARRFPLHRDGVVVAYSARCTDEAWQAWNAALDSLCVTLPAPLPSDEPYACYEGGWNDMRSEVQDALTAAGVPYK